MIVDLLVFSADYLATVVLAYRNLTSQYTIPRKIALARIISEIASILIINNIQILVSIYTESNRY
ncbi:hypothetical protein EU97_0801 [Prochlorococcus marinus str. MIT 9311]|nr:hypothetical protein EU97_0801 [Prochlorococcus marinus str. MIT 9311]